MQNQADPKTSPLVPSSSRTNLDSTQNTAAASSVTGLQIKTSIKGGLGNFYNGNHNQTQMQAD